MQRQDGKEYIPVMYLQHRRSHHEVSDQVFMVEHYALRISGGARSEQDDGQLLRIYLRIQESSVAFLHEFLSFLDQLAV